MEVPFKNKHFQNQKESVKRKACLHNVTVFFVCLLFSTFLFGCKSIQYVPVETIKIERSHSTDTIIVKDTIQNERETIIREASESDSALLSKLGLQLDTSQRVILLLQKELAKKSHTEIERKSDTIEIEKEIKVPYPVEKQLSKWEKIRLKLGSISIIVFSVFVVLIVFWLVVNKRVSNK